MKPKWVNGVSMDELSEWLGDDPVNTDRLHPDLRPYLTVNRQLGIPVLKSPLIVQLMPMWKPVNTEYVTKKHLFDAAVERGDFHTAVSLLTNPFRLDFLRQWYRARWMTRHALRAELPWVWSSAEPDDTKVCWRALWRHAALPGPLLEEPLPGDAAGPLLVYRGVADPQERRGIAWTTSIETARFFATRFRPEGGYVLAGMMERSDVWAYITRRSEAEVICDPKCVTVLDWTFQPGSRDAVDPETKMDLAATDDGHVTMCGNPLTGWGETGEDA